MLPQSDNNDCAHSTHENIHHVNVKQLEKATVESLLCVGKCSFPTFQLLAKRWTYEPQGPGHGANVSSD